MQYSGWSSNSQSFRYGDWISRGRFSGNLSQLDSPCSLRPTSNLQHRSRVPSSAANPHRDSRLCTELGKPTKCDLDRIVVAGGLELRLRSYHRACMLRDSVRMLGDQSQRQNNRPCNRSSSACRNCHDNCDTIYDQSRPGQSERQAW